MGYKAIYAYAWDLAESGVSEALGRFGALGLDTVTIAGSYHAGKFLRPHGKRERSIFPRTGPSISGPTPSATARSSPSPIPCWPSATCCASSTDQGRLQTNVWLVLMHNTRLGTQHPEATVANAFGDRYIYNLCPSAPDARAYAIGLAQDVTDVLSGQRRLAGDAGFPALCARIIITSSR